MSLWQCYFFTKLSNNSAVFLFKLMESNGWLINLIMESIHIFQYGAIFKKMTFSNIILPNKALLIVVLVFLIVKFGKAFCCNVVSTENFLKRSYLKSYLYQQICKFLNFHGFISLWWIFFVYMKCVLCFFIQCCIIYTYCLTVYSLM